LTAITCAAAGAASAPDTASAANVVLPTT
jgi:hypothetical protein